MSANSVPVGRDTAGRDPAVLTRSGSALREAIRRAGLSYEAVAHRLGLKGRSSVAQWCSGSIPVPLPYHVTLRRLLRAPDLFPETALPTSEAPEYSILGALLRSFASMPALPLELVERTSWDVWTEYTRKADWHSAGRYTEALQEATIHWRNRRGQTSRRLERIRWAAAHGQLRARLYTCDWEEVERLSHSLRQEIYRSTWLDALDHPEQALILNTLSLAEFFLKSRFRRMDAGHASGKLSALRQALTGALTHLGEAERRLRLPVQPGKPAASSLRCEVAQLLLDATEASMIYEAREDPAMASAFVHTAERVALLAAGADTNGPGANGPDTAGVDTTGQTLEGMSQEYRATMFEEILPRIELECRYNAAVIGALAQDEPGVDRALVARSTAALENLEQAIPASRHWRSELRMTELFRILNRVSTDPGALDRDGCLQMRHALGDLREDFHRNALMGPARSAATLEVALDVNLFLLPKTPPPEKEERLQSAAEIVDWMDATLESYPDAPTALVVQWDRAVLSLLGGVREASTVRDLIDVLQRFREYGGKRIPTAAARFLSRVAAGEFGERAAAAVPASVREGLPAPQPDGGEADSENTGGSTGMALVLAPLLYPMMPISFIRPQGYQQPSAAFWEETFALESE